MTQLINQFELGKEKGQLDLRQNVNVLSCRTDSVLVPGQPVKLVDVAGGVPNVTAVTADTDEVFGYVSKNFRKDATAIGDVVEIALGGCVMYMIAGAAVASGADLMYVTATGKVITATGATKIISAYALDRAAADGDLIRVYIKSAVDKSGVLGFSGTVTFYAAATSGGAITVLNTIIYLNGKVLSHTQA